MGDKEKIDGLFKEKLGRFEADPAEDAWGPIQDRLNGRKRKRRVLYLRWMSTAAALVLAFFSGYYMQVGNQPAVMPDVSKDVVTPYTPEDIRIQEDQQLANDPVSDPQKEGVEVSGIDADETGSVETLAAVASASKKENTIPERENLMALQPIDHKKATAMRHVMDFGFTARQDLLPMELANPAPEITDGNDAQASAAVAGTDPLNTNKDQIRYFSDDPTKKKQRNKDRFAVGMAAGPAIPFNDVSFKESSNLTNQNVENDELTNTYAAGINASYSSNKHWEWQVGVYVNKWEQSNNDILLARSLQGNTGTNVGDKVEATTSSGILSFDPANFSNSNQVIGEAGITDQGETFFLVPKLQLRYDFVEIPMSTAYYFLHGRFSLKAQAGLNMRILSNSQALFSYGDGRTENVEGLEPRDVSMQLTFGPGFSYRFLKNLSFDLTPLVYYGVTPTYSSSELDTYYHQFVIFSGVSYSF